MIPNIFFVLYLPTAVYYFVFFINISLLCEMSLSTELKKTLIARSVALISTKEPEPEDSKKTLALYKVKVKLQKTFELLIKSGEIVDASMTTQGLNKLFEACCCFEAALFYQEEKEIEKKAKGKKSTL